ncbi:hypothetical protein ACPA0F_18550 [Solibacillus silvestris]
MDASVISAISGFAGVLITSIVSVVVTKTNSKKDVTIVDRQQLSQDQQAFYNIVMNQVTDLQNRATKLEEELSQWKTQAAQLGIENTQLKEKVRVLEEQVTEYRKD